MDNPLPVLAPEELRLPNGLGVVLLERRFVPLVAVNISYRVGSKNERRGRTGFAHLFEHMMFQGSKHFNQDYFRPLNEIGAEVNGATSTDRTRYWELVPAAYLERALWLESDRMGFLLDALTAERLATQVSVVQNERRQSYENRPYGTVRERMLAALYPPDHPYHWPTIGFMEDIAAATLEDVQAFFRDYYTPSNASLCIVGDIERANARSLIERYFADLPPGQPVAGLRRWVPSPRAAELEIEDRVQLPRTYVAWHTVPLFDPDDAALDVFARVLGGGRTSRLYRNLVYERRIAQDASAFHGSSELAGTFNLVLTPRPPHTLGEVEAAALAVLGELLEGGVTALELERIQTATTAAFVRGMQEIGRFGGLSDRLNEYLHYLGRADAFRFDLQRTLDLTPEAVTRAGRAYLAAPRVVARVRPFGRPAASPGSGVDRARMPGRGGEKPLQTPRLERFELASGLPVVLAPHPDVPLVTVAVLLRSGSAQDPSAHPGLATLLGALLPEGAGGRSAREIAEEVEGLGLELDASTGADATVLRVAALPAVLPAGLRLLADLALAPDLRPDEIERQRERRLTSLLQLRDQPSYLAQLALQRALFSGHPYGLPSLGTPASVRGLDEAMLRLHWRRHFRPDNAALLVVGETNAAAIAPLLEEAFGAWNAPGAQPEVIPAPPQHGARTLYLVDRPGSAQAIVACAQIGVDRRSPDFAALNVANAALGGQFVSRLNLNLREDKGYTYGVRSRFDFGRAPGSFSVSASVATDVTVPALREIVGELESLLGPRPLDAGEVEYAQGWIVDGYARRFESQAQVLQAALELELHNLPAETIADYPRQVRSLDADEVAAAVRRVLVPDRLALVVVGDAAKVRAPLLASGLAPLVELDLTELLS